MKNIVTVQNSTTKSFEQSRGLIKRRTDVTQTWLDKTNHIANSVTRNRCWKCGILVRDDLTVVSNTIAEDGSRFTGFKGKK